MAAMCRHSFNIEPYGSPIIEIINYNKFVETQREDFFKGIKQLQKQNTENKLHTKLEAQ
jgi:hypothetical protein